ncbi:MAG: nucleotide sugar dehydrogenase [Deltaproteobacteria bacterium]|nr:nucleotide sugar dehydrogenase [Deltaproteobacteria bacterium]MBI4224100.1 nucleotide sugar dehydrogenase [Deltaproteobacteria bacterium]
MTRKTNICVLGLGYIGLPTACLFAQAGFQVLGVDINPEVVEGVNAGDSHLDLEPDLSEALAGVVREGRLQAACKPVPADLFLICVPTPFKEEHQADLTYIEAALDSILPFIRPGNTIVLESTSPPGTTEKVVAGALKTKGFTAGKDCFVAYCPERVLPGKIMRELKVNARIVGGVTPACGRQASQFYKKIVDAEVMETTARTAEVVKLVENSFRDVNIAFANEISMFCDRLQVSHREVIRLANHHPRVNILTPGPGVGGHCIAVDPWFLVEALPEQTALIRTARNVNLSKTRYVISTIHRNVNERFKATGLFQKVYLFGMTYKADVADFRESPSIDIYHGLVKELGKMAHLYVVDPYLDEGGYGLSERLPAVPLDQVPSMAASILWVQLTAHRSFQGLNFTLNFSS